MAVSAGGPVAARRFPSAASYVEALQNPSLCFEDPDLKHGSVQQTPVLGPKAISGNFASVFSITAPGGQRFALKCFTRESNTLEARYRAISKRLADLKNANLSQPWTVGIEYLPKGVLVAGEWYPTLKMAWAEGTNLIAWIDRHVRDSAAVFDTAARFAALVADLEAAGIAHGDFQHGNLLVASDGTFRLVDYDGMYVPELKGQGATENGHRNYQSPTRTSADFGPETDRFSSWIIYLSLLAIATDPNLWDQLHEDQGEYLILKEEDFKDSKSSLAWSLLLTHSDQHIRGLAAQTHGMLSTAARALPSLSMAAPIPSPIPTQRAAPAAAARAGAPSWLAGHMTAPQNGSAHTGFPPGPAAGPVGVPRRPADVLSGIVALAGVTAPLSVLAVLPAGYPVTQVMAFLASGAVLHAARRSRPEAKTSRARLRALRQQLRGMEDPALAAKRVRDEIADLAKASARKDALINERIKNLQVEQRDEQARITRDLNKETGSLTSKLNSLAVEEQRQLDSALAAAVTKHIHGHLSRTKIEDVKRLSNMGAGTVAALVAAGIRSAADFTGVRYVQGGRYNTRDAYLLLSNGRSVKVPGVGEVRATALERWRNSLEERARRTAPTALSAQEKASIRQLSAMRKKRYEGEIAQAESRAGRKRDELQQRIAALLQQANQEKQQQQRDAQKNTAVLRGRQTQLAAMSNTRQALKAQLASARTEHRRAFSLRRYVRFVATGR